MKILSNETYSCVSLTRGLLTPAVQSKLSNPSEGSGPHDYLQCVTVQCVIITMIIVYYRAKVKQGSVTIPQEPTKLVIVLLVMLLVSSSTVVI